MDKRRKYHNDWIIEHKDEFSSWTDMCKEYNRVFGTDINRARFKSHCSGDLKLRLNNYFYTEEQKAFLTEHYPIYGAKETTEKFNKKFSQNRSVHSIKETSLSLGVCLNEEAFAKYKQETTEFLINYNKTVRAKEVGTIGRPSNGYDMIKTEDGTWEYLGKYLYEKHIGKVPDGYQVIFLDGDQKNREISNLAIVPISYQMLMNTLKLRSDNADITATGIKWCDLYQLLKSENVHIDTN